MVDLLKAVPLLPNADSFGLGAEEAVVAEVAEAEAVVSLAVEVSVGANAVTVAEIVGARLGAVLVVERATKTSSILHLKVIVIVLFGRSVLGQHLIPFISS